MTLGALYRCLLDRLDAPFGLRVGIHFEERTSIVVEDAAAGTEPTRIEQRTYDADLTVREGQVVGARLTAGAIGAETLVVRVAEFDGASRYSIAGEGFGVLGVRPELFDLEAFEVRLDGVAVSDAVIDQETPDGSGRIVVDAEIDSEAFTRLLRAFGGGESENPELPAALTLCSALRLVRRDPGLLVVASGPGRGRGPAGAPQRSRLSCPRVVCAAGRC